MPPETAHGIAKWVFRRSWLWRPLRRGLCFEDERLRIEVGRLRLANPIGLAAGFDKNCELSKTLFDFGFGYVTLGTVTLNPREGNPKPRIWRYPQQHALVNSMGLPNDGAHLASENLSKHETRRGAIIVSISGLSIEDFTGCYAEVESVADGIELNISTPNTAGVRIFQEPPVLTKLLDAIAVVKKRDIPIWVKMPPYFNEKERENVLALVEICRKKSVDGITAINTKLVPEPRASIGTGGLSGPPIFQDMLRIVEDIYRYASGKIPINACGGISSGKDAWRAIEVGASTIQLYTAFIYEGPSVASKINRELLQLLRSSNRDSLSEVVGSGLQ